MLVDAHCHLQDIVFDTDRDAVLARCQEFDCLCINAADSLEESVKAVHLAERFRFIFATVGIHPHHAGTVAFDPASFHPLVVHPRVVAVGEIGLDYSGVGAHDLALQMKQRELFRAQLQFAALQHKPVVIHCRDAYMDALQILADFPQLPFMMHTFAGDADTVQKFLAVGAMISFSGMITFPNAETIRNAVRAVPLNRMLIETDAPYLAPVPHRGKRNEPANVRFVVEKIAELKNIPREEVVRQTTKNAVRFFHLPSA